MSQADILKKQILVAEMGANIAGVLADIAREQKQVGGDKHQLIATCTYCGKDRGSQLRSCTRCKAARYCDATCQRADYKTRHRRECAEFIHPPRTRSFRTRPVGDEKYPNEPVFGQGHDGDVGCWVSAGCRVDCQLAQLAPEIHPSDRIEIARRARVRAQSSSQANEVFHRTLCTTRICIQNRHKDNVAILVFPSRAQVVTSASSTDTVLRGQVETYDNVVTFMRNGEKFAAVGVPKDPEDNRPRVDVAHINGQGAREPPYPPGLRNVDEGIVALNPGDFAIIWIQFRVGDEHTINMEWQALRCLDHIIVPFMPWDRISQPAALAAAIPPAYTLPDLAARTAHASAVKHLRVRFDQDAITAHYYDYIEHGEEAFFRTHRGKVHMDLARVFAKSSAVMEETVATREFTPEEIEASRVIGRFLTASFHGSLF